MINYVCSGSRIAFDGKGSWSFQDDFVQKVIVLRVENKSSSHLKNDFLILSEGDTFCNL